MSPRTDTFDERRRTGKNLESFAGWSFRSAIRTILGAEAADAYEGALLTGESCYAGDERHTAVLGFAFAFAQSHNDVVGAAKYWLEPHFSEEHARTLIAFAGAVRSFPSAFA